MIELLGRWLAHYYHGFNLLQYLTLRTLLASLTSLILSLWLGPKMIAYLQRLQIGQAVRDDGPKTHLSKSGTPTMGGALIVLAITITTLLWTDLSNLYIWFVLIVLCGFAAIGWVDDHRKVVMKNSKGLPARYKYLWQSILGLGVAIGLYVTAHDPLQTALYVPFIKEIHPALGIGFIVLTFY